MTKPKAATKIEMRKIGDVKPYEKNARKHPKQQVEQLAMLIKRHGFDQPIVVDGKGTIIKGHGRLLAAEHLGLERVPVVVRDDLSPALVREARIADNRVPELGSWDTELLSEDVMDAMSLDGFDLDALGLKASFVAAHIRMPGEVVEPDTPDLPKNPITKLGDVWYMGQHVLTCGDSTKVKLKKAPHTIFTDPPYGVNWSSRSDRAEKFDLIANDKLSGKQLADFVRGSVPDAQFRFVCCNYRCFTTFEEALGKPQAVIVWDKGSIGLGHSNFYRPQHEWIMFFGPSQKGGSSLSDVWPLARDREYKHPTQKPVALVAKALTDVDAENVFDPFGGSGATLLAAAQLGIPCTTVELEPKYCDVIVERWETLTGEKATRG